MRHVMLVLVFSSLAGCGVETATTAATGAAVKKQEIDAGKKTMSEARQKIDQAQQLQQNARRETDAASQ